MEVDKDIGKQEIINNNFFNYLPCIEKPTIADVPFRLVISMDHEAKLRTTPH